MMGVSARVRIFTSTGRLAIQDGDRGETNQNRLQFHEIGAMHSGHTVRLKVVR